MDQPAIGYLDDFVNPLYFVPGNKNATMQLTPLQLPEPVQHALEPPVRRRAAHHDSALIMFIFFQRQIVSGMTAGVVKG